MESMAGPLRNLDVGNIHSTQVIIGENGGASKKFRCWQYSLNTRN